MFSRNKKTKIEDMKVSERTSWLREHFKKTKPELKDFKLVQTLGTGTFGRVRLATIAIDNKEHVFAIKSLSKAEVCRLKQIEHVKSEKENLYSVSHSFVTILYHTFQDKLSIHLVLEFLIGGEFFAYLRRKGRLDVASARFYAAEMVTALTYLHGKGIIYRDLKPENILFTAEGHLKLADFGFSKKLKKNRRTWTLCGTPEYLAPEVIHSVGHHHGVDWWALGVLTFEMLAGYPPFYDEQPFGIYQSIVAGVNKVKFPQHMDAKAVHFIKSLLQEDYNQRLGCLRNGGYDVRKHRWFRGLGYKTIIALVTPPPYIPKVSGPLDTSHFDTYEDEDEENENLITKSEDANFAGF
uniref:cAMP-dependent protein kinase catalytic subunit n=1 Tax=Lotharella oceanica TaxID=641309 RepID=A0A7S2XEK6_9EUKA|mmetsp:Transcript_34103/g.63230  ORF Transcript_34103/g.63230 Transcript_34103/m.63230 type:complete len:352 (+) Transcript_34103:3-1058(+)